MTLFGLLLLTTGILLNISVLRGPLSTRLTPGQILRSWPWLASLGLVLVGLVLLLAAGH